MKLKLAHFAVTLVFSASCVTCWLALGEITDSFRVMLEGHGLPAFTELILAISGALPLLALVAAFCSMAFAMREEPRLTSFTAYTAALLLIQASVFSLIITAVALPWLKITTAVGGVVK